MAKYTRNQEVFFYHIQNGLHIGRELVEEIHEDKKGVKYWLGAYVCHENQVFADHEDLVKSVNEIVEKSLKKLLQLEPFL